MNYIIYGPFEVPRTGSAVSRARQDKRSFWETIEKAAEGLSGACGCYVFVVRKRARYIGLAEKSSFKHECFALHKILQYNEALRSVSGAPGAPSLLLLPKVTQGRRFAKPSARGHRDIRLLENLLIGSALARHCKLQNVKGTTLLREMCVPGVLNTKPGRPSSSVQCLKAALGL